MDQTYRHNYVSVMMPNTQIMFETYTTINRWKLIKLHKSLDSKFFSFNHKLNNESSIVSAKFTAIDKQEYSKMSKYFSKTNFCWRLWRFDAYYRYKYLSIRIKVATLSDRLEEYWSINPAIWKLFWALRNRPSF